MGVESWSLNPDANTAVGGVQIGEGSARSDVNNAQRATLAEIKGSVRGVYSVLRDIPVAKHAGIAAGTNTDNLQSYFATAATAAVAAKVPLHFPAGTYCLLTWSPPANLEVTTDGPATIFKQLDTSSTATRVIKIEQDGIRLWVGGAATIDGSMNTYAGNATEQNHGILVDPADGVTIKSFVCGDVYGRNLGGDVITTFVSDTGYLEHCRFGDIYGFNTYRVIAGLTAGTTVVVGNIIDQGVNGGEGSGIGAVFVELDATNNSPIQSLTIGTIKGRIMNLAGIPLGVRLGRVTIHAIDLDGTRPMSSPEYDEGGLNKTTQPALFYTGLQYRELDSVYIGHAKIANCSAGAIKDIGEGSVNWSGRMAFGELELINNGNATYPREIVLQKTRQFWVGKLTNTEKASEAYPVFINGVAGGSAVVDSIESVGRLAAVACDIRVGDGSVDADGEHLFYYTTGQIDIENLDITGTAVSLFLGATKIPTVKNCTIAAPTSVLGSGGDAAPNVRLINTTIGATTYGDRLYTPLTAVGDATAAAGATPTQAEFDALVGKFNSLLDKLGVSGAGLTQDA